MLNLMLSHALSMLYLCSIYAWAMEYLWQKYELSGRAGRVFFGKIGKMRGFRKIRKQEGEING